MKEFDPDGPVASNEGGILAKLWKTVIKDNNLKPALDHLVIRYLSANSMNVKSVKKKTKSSLKDNITASEMTWKTFTNLIFNYLRVIRMDITIKLTLANGDETIHNVTVENNTEEGRKDEKPNT